MASIFNFIEKEGKWFTPVTSTKPKYIVRGGVVEQDGTSIVSGIKGAYGKVRITLDEDFRGTKSELFAVNTEAVHSSN